jgi:hypothetical protein
MQERTFSIELPTSRDQAFRYISDMNNLPDWAPGFCTQLKRVNGKLIAQTPMGDLYLRVNADAATGVIDMYANPREDGNDHLSTRLVTTPDGRTLYVVMFFRDAGLSDDEYALHCASVERDLVSIRQRLS